MVITDFPDADEIITIILNKLQTILGNKLVGLYLEGSLVVGDYDPRISDVDLVAALADHITDEEFMKLKEMHEMIVKEKQEWYDRIEVCYITVDALKNVREKSDEVVNISPGEPIHRLESSPDWIMNWYLTREKGLSIYGPSPKEIIAPITKEEFFQCIKKHAKSWNIWIQKLRNPYAQSYAIFTLCRALYTLYNGEQTSKKQAALWAQKEYPEWAEIIQQAFEWRNGPKYSPPDEVNFPRTLAFVNFAREKILNP